MSELLTDKVALITGGASGIGRRCAQVFGEAGARIVIVDRDADAGAQALSQLQESGINARFTQVDVNVPVQMEAAVAQTVTDFGGLHTLVSSAGIGGRRYGDGPVDRCTVDAWDTIMGVNLRGTFLACKYAIPELLRQRGSSIVTISSVLGMVGTQGLYDTHAYTTSKAAIIGLTRNIAVHYARQKLRANTIAPGLVDTGMAERTKADPALYEQISFWQPLKPIGEVDDVAYAALFLASDRAAFITGTVLPVDGGWSAQ